MKKLENQSLKNKGPLYEDILYGKTVTVPVAQKIRKCRNCDAKLPETNYFHCDVCKARLESEEDSDGGH